VIGVVVLGVLIAIGTVSTRYLLCAVNVILVRLIKIIQILNLYILTTLWQPLVAQPPITILLETTTASHSLHLHISLSCLLLLKHFSQLEIELLKLVLLLAFLIKLTLDFGKLGFEIINLFSKNFYI
jgi:hypothetical protein